MVQLNQVMLTDTWLLSDAVSVAVTGIFWCVVWLLIWQRSARGRVSRVMLCMLGIWACLSGWPVLGWFGVDQWSVFWWRGVWGDLSVASWVMIAAGLLAVLRNKLVLTHSASVGWMAAVILVLGAVFYPPMLGLGMWDPYVWGYHEPVFLAAVMAVGIISVWCRQWGILVWSMLSVLMWQLQLYDSRNLWDYLLDPVVWVVAIGYWANRLWHARI